MSLLANVLGFSALGLTARFMQLGIQRRPPFENLYAHAASTAVFGYLGYLSWDYDQRMAAPLAERRLALEGRDAKRKETLAKVNEERSRDREEMQAQHAA